MARKPIHLERAGMLTPRERLWDAARRLSRKGDGTFTQEGWQDATKPVVHMQTCKSYLGALLKAGYFEPAGDVQVARAGCFARTSYRLVKDSLDAPRLNEKGEPVTQGTGVTAMWRAMQVLKVFDWHDIQRAASVPGSVVRPETAKRYVLELARTGYYFHQVEAAKPGKAARYRLVRNTGAHPPAVCRREVVFDRNTGEFAWQQSEQEVVDGIE